MCRTHSIDSYRRYDDHYQGSVVCEPDQCTKQSTQREGSTYLFKGKLIGLLFDNEVRKAKLFEPLSNEKRGCEILVKS